MHKKFSQFRLVKLAILAIATLLLAACVVPAAPAESGADAAVEPGEMVTVRFAVPRWASTTDRRVERQIAFRSVIDSFNAAYADRGWQVEEVVFDGNQVTLIQEIEAGNVDAFWYNHSEYANMVRAGHVLELDPYMNGEGEQFFDWVQETMKGVDGKYYSLWHNTDTPLFYYNTEMIPEPPETWSEVEAMAQAIRESEGGDVYGFTHPFVGWGQMNSGLFLALGGEYVDEEGAPLAFTDENKAIWQAMFEYYIGLLENDLIPPSAVANDQIQQMPDVYAGNIHSFAGNSNFHIRQLQPNLPEEEYVKWSAAPLPYPDEAGQGLYEAGGWLIGARSTDDPAMAEAAAAFVLHATGDTAQANTNRAGGWIPTRPGILADDPFYSDDFFAQVTLEALENGHIVPQFPIYIPTRLAIETALSHAATGEVSIEQAIEDAAAEVEREYAALQSQ